MQRHLRSARIVMFCLLCLGLPACAAVHTQPARPVDWSLLEAPESPVVDNDTTYGLEEARLLPLEQARALLLLPLKLEPYTTGELLILTEDGGTTWRAVGATRGNITEWFILDPDHLWLLSHWQIEGSFPILYRSSDGGASWLESDAIEALLRELDRCCANWAESLFFRDPLRGTVQTNGDLLLATDDGGQSWTVKNHQTPPREEDGGSPDSAALNVAQRWWRLERTAGQLNIYHRQAGRFVLVLSLPGQLPERTAVGGGVAE